MTKVWVRMGSPFTNSTHLATPRPLAPRQNHRFFMKTWPGPDDTLTPHTGPHRGAAHTVDKPLANMVAGRPCQATSPKIPGSDNKGSAAYCWQESDLFQAVARARTAPAPQIAPATGTGGTTEEELVALTVPYGTDQKIGVWRRKRRQWKLGWTFSKGEVQVGHAKRAVWLMAMKNSWLHTQEFIWRSYRSYRKKFIILSIDHHFILKNVK